MAGWSVSRDYLKLADATINSITSCIDGTGADKVVVDLAKLAIEGKVPQSHFLKLKAFARLVDYDGFNPLTIIVELTKKAQQTIEKAGSDFEFTDAGVTYKVTFANDLSQDVQLFYTLFLVRGNNLFKILKTVSKDAKAAISHKIAAYGIKSDSEEEAASRKRKEKVTLSSKDITLSRVAASFPHITLAVAKAAEIIGKVDLFALKLMFVIQNPERRNEQVPHVLQHGLLPALLSKEERTDEAELKGFCHAFNLEQTLTLLSPAAKKQAYTEPLNTMIEGSIKFVSAATQGPLFEDEARRVIRASLLNEAGIKAWISAGNAVWMRMLSTGTYSSLISSLMDEKNKSLSTEIESQAGSSQTTSTGAGRGSK